MIVIRSDSGMKKRSTDSENAPASSKKKPYLSASVMSCASVASLCLIIGILSQSWVILGIALLLYMPLARFLTLSAIVAIRGWNHG